MKGQLGHGEQKLKTSTPEIVKIVPSNVIVKHIACGESQTAMISGKI